MRGLRVNWNNLRMNRNHKRTYVLALQGLSSVLTPCENITYSDFSSWPIMSQRPQQHWTFQCMFWNQHKHMAFKMSLLAVFVDSCTLYLHYMDQEGAFSSLLINLRIVLLIDQ